MPQKLKSTAMVIIKRLSVERCFGIKSFKKSPKSPPRRSTARFKAMGIRILLSLKEPDCKATATEIAMLYATRPKTLSNATTCKRVFTNSPLALNCLMVIIVEAEAVVAAKAPKTKDRLKFNFKIKRQSTKTKREARVASKRVIIQTFSPFCFSVEKVKNSPVPKAIKARAISAIKLVPSIMSGFTRFKQ